MKAYEKTIWIPEQTLVSAESLNNIENQVEMLTNEKENSFIKNSAFNKHFGIGPDTVAEGDHQHYDFDLRLKKLEKSLNLINNLESSMNDVGASNITPSYTLYSKSSRNVTDVTIEQNLISFTTSTDDEGVTTESLSSLIPKVEGQTIQLSANVETENTVAIVKMKYSSGWKFLKLFKDEASKTVSVDPGLIYFKVAVENTSDGIQNTCIVKNLKLEVIKELDIKSNKDIPDRNYSIWSWSEEQIFDAVNTKDFLNRYKINRIYQFIHDSVDRNSIKSFAKVLQENGVTINWLTGSPKQSLREHHVKAMNELKKIKAYNSSISNGYEKIGTVQFDIEPYTLPEWIEDEASVIEQYQEVVAMLHEECGRLGLSLSMCIPHWFNTKEYNNKFGQGNLYDFVSKNSSCTVIMAYSVNNYIDFVREEIEINKSNRKRLAIGFETKPVGDHGLTTDQTFGDKTVKELYSAFETLYKYQNESGFHDKYEFAIHDFIAFKNFIEGASLEIIEANANGPLFAIMEKLQTGEKTVIGAINELLNRIVALESK